MPAYNYSCSSCEHEFEDIQSIAERHLPETLPCPNCFHKTVIMRIGAPAICSSHRLDAAKSSKPQGDFRERMQQIKKHFAKDKKANIPDF
jgi:putative FmdB family regulatory protein